MRITKAINISIGLLLLFSLSEFVALGRVHVTITNRLGNGRSMNLHCQSGDDDLGYVRLPDGIATEWSFRVNFWGTTLFYCDVQWDESNWHHFDVYSYKHDAVRCDTECDWMLSEHGDLYVYDQYTGHWSYVPFQDN